MAGLSQQGENGEKGTVKKTHAHTHTHTIQLGPSRSLFSGETERRRCSFNRSSSGMFKPGVGEAQAVAPYLAVAFPTTDMGKEAGLPRCDF